MKPVILTAIVLLMTISPFAADFTDYQRIAISSPLINQINTNPEISDVEDLQLQPEVQIMLYEDLAGRICEALTGNYNKNVEFICFNNIKDRLDAESWNQFNKTFTGQSEVEPEMANEFGEKLEADGLLNSNLIFSYFQNSKNSRCLEIHFEWYLIDLSNGRVALADEYDCKDKFGNEKAAERERKCFNSIVEVFTDSGR